MRNIELPLSASFVLLRTLTVRPSVEGCFIDVLKHARQHLLPSPPTLHALVVIEEPVLDIRISIAVPPTSASDTPVDVNESPGDHASGTPAVMLSGKVLPALTSWAQPQRLPVRFSGLGFWQRPPIPCTHHSAT